MLIDELIIKFVHMLNELGGVFFTPFFHLITMLCEKGWIFLLIAFILCLRKKTRWIGATIILSTAIGYIVSDFCFKPMIGRLRPYDSGDNLLYQFWIDAGAYKDTGFSMPSGHTIAASAFFISLYITCKNELRKNILIAGIVTVLLVALSRCYLMHHYFTDCLLGIVITIFISFIAKFIVKIFFKLFKKYEKVPLFGFIINFDIIDLIKKK